ncbi:hypothetical protein GQ600_775 [Phytophthora cactorum]|nr:hypothetical protein GQ600_775 [Phytophthora cactorum]
MFTKKKLCDVKLRFEFSDDGLNTEWKRRQSLGCRCWYRRQRFRRREKSASIIQRAWRISVSKAKIKYYSRAYRHLTNLRRLERSARIVQRSLGKRVIQRGLLVSKYHGSFLATTSSGGRAGSTFWRQERQSLEDETAERNRLEKEEKTLQSDIESLQRCLTDAKTRLNEESERLRRHSTLEEHRRLKDEEAKQKRLQEVEETMRQAIRRSSSGSSRLRVASCCAARDATASM